MAFEATEGLDCAVQLNALGLVTTVFSGMIFDMRICSVFKEEFDILKR